MARLPAFPGKLLVAVLVTSCALLAITSLNRALAWYGRPVAGVLVTPDCDVSAIGLPSWDGWKRGLRFPERIVATDGERLTFGRSERCASAFYARVDEAWQAGRTSLDVTVERGHGEVTVRLAIAPLEASVWWLYAGGMLLTGVLFFAAGILARVASPRGQLSGTFCKLACLAGTFFITFFDWHTSATLGACFLASFALAPMAIVALALRLPDDVPLLSRAPFLLTALDAAGSTLAVVLVARFGMGASTLAGRQVASALLIAGLFVFGVVLLGRFLRARGTRRRILGALVYAMVPPSGLVAAGIASSVLFPQGSAAAFFAIPAYGLVPLAVASAFIRYDIWGSRALLSRVFTQVFAALVTASLAIAIGAAFATSVGVPFRAALLSATASGLAATSLLYLALRAVDREFFPAVADYKPTIEQLSDELTSISSPGEVASAVERTVRRWLPCDDVEVRVQGDLDVPSSGAGSGEPTVAVPIRFRGERLGVIRAGQKRGGALYTSEDVDLLRTTANQAALALAHARSYGELEERRRTHVAAFQAERLALVETLTSEIAHEVRYPINFFRSLFRKGDTGRVLDDEEVDIACEEVDRLERLVAGFRRIVGSRTERRAVRLLDLAAKGELLLRDSLLGKSFENTIPEDIILFADPDQATQMIVNLLSNAIDAVSDRPRERLGIAWTATDAGGEFQIWDTGAGFDDDPSKLFAPWFTTKPRGTGLGLAITQRLVRAHGWRIDAERTRGTTRFVVRVPASDIMLPGAPRSGVEVA